jgi:predicted negative regulator of RcsB-dependent stress response
MTLTCPCCRASNDTAVCRRCKADLSLLAALEDRRGYHLTLARRFAAEGQFEHALRHADHAQHLRLAPDVNQLRAALLLLKGDFAAALRAYDEPA